MNPFLLESFFLLDGEFWVKLNGKEKREKRREEGETGKEKGRRKWRARGRWSGIITLRGNEKWETKNSKYQ